MATRLLMRVWDFAKETKMAYTDWDGRLAGTNTKGFYRDTP